MDLTEGVGESSSRPRMIGICNEIKNEVYYRLLKHGREEAICKSEFRQLLDSHFNRLPDSYPMNINLERVEDVLLHQKLLALAKDPVNQPVFNVRFLENFKTPLDGNHEEQSLVDSDGSMQSHRHKNREIDFEPWSKLESLNLEVRRNSIDMERQNLEEDSSRRQEISKMPPVHEVIFSTVGTPKLLSQLSALLSDIKLNIREAHIFSTTDGYSLDVFLVDGWPILETEGIREAMEKAIAQSEGSWSGSSHSQSTVEIVLDAKSEFGDGEIDRSLLKMGEKIASGSCVDLYRGEYLGQDVAVKILKYEDLKKSQEDEFMREVAILREVKHGNIVRFFGACTKSSPLIILTEYMPRGSLYEYLQRNPMIPELPQLLKFAIDVCKGMEYLHQKGIIHRDLKTANLLMDAHNAIKVADFGVARFRNHGGVMTREAGTYKWMAPEVMKGEPYDQKADVYSFAIVLWELVTAKVPYESMTPVQAAFKVTVLGGRPELPPKTHPKLLDLMQRCWDVNPGNRPSFYEIRIELEGLLLKVQDQANLPSDSS